MIGSLGYRILKVINAPIGFVYNWCVYFREDDDRICGLRTRRIIMQKTKGRVQLRRSASPSMPQPHHLVVSCMTIAQMSLISSPG